ncbi:unnamed protein product [Effrenium voratum]|uniref:Uncharacterized protein n=1 Tax=Effrenium voratum TaxID=2562239 RepID=A0AA36IR27_9DINO|nr:unnamed protein product [Effrenium voratum]
MAPVLELRRADSSAAGSPFSGRRHRRRSTSFALLPQDERGITLQELIHLRDHEEMREVRWHCENEEAMGCASQPRGFQGPCSCQNSLAQGRWRTPNLYEVVNDIVLKRYCNESAALSYVEYLKDCQRRDGGVRKVRTFVSHWWGEEFCNLVASLTRFAEAECMQRQSLRLWVLLHSTLALLLNAHLSLRLMRQHEKLDDLYARSISDTLLVIVSNSLVSALVMALALLEARFNRRQALRWSFWICAFANNQHELSHALGGTVDASSFALALQSECLQSMVCVIDSQCVIYRRLWCAFELFYVTHVLPKGGRHFSAKKIPLELANADGVISQGGLNDSLLQQIHAAILKVKTKNAKASKEEDEKKIHDFIEEKTTHGRLDATLREITHIGLDSASLRRRSPLILFFFCPVASFALSGTVFWLVLACNEQDAGVVSLLRFTVLFLFFLVVFFFLFVIIFLRFTVLTYFFLSVGAVSVILLLCFGSFEVGWHHEAHEAPRPPNSDTSSDESEASRSPAPARSVLASLKELRVKIAFPSAYTRLQRRAFTKAICGVFFLAGPGLLLTPPLLLLEHGFGSKSAKEWLQLLQNLRCLWNLVQVTYACVGLLLGSLSFLVRNRVAALRLLEGALL